MKKLQSIRAKSAVWLFMPGADAADAKDGNAYKQPDPKMAAGISWWQLYSAPNVGRKTIAEIEAWLKSHRLSLGDKPPAPKRRRRR